MLNMGQTSSNPQSNYLYEEESYDLYQKNRLNEPNCNNLAYNKLLTLYYINGRIMRSINADNSLKQDLTSM